MSLENPFLGITFLTSTENRYLKDKNKSAPARVQKLHYISREIDDPDGKILLNQQNMCFNVENKYLKFYEHNCNQSKRSLCKKKIPLNFKSDPSKVFECDRVQCDSLPEYAPVADFSEISSNMFADALDATAGFGASTSAMLFGAPPPMGCARAWHCDSSHPVLRKGASKRVPEKSQKYTADDRVEGPVIPDSGNTFSFFSQLQEQVEKIEIKHTEFSSVHGMPIYNLTKMEMNEYLQSSFQSLETDNEMIKLQKVKLMKFMKVKLLNATCMSMVYSPNFKDASDKFRLFLIKCADDVIKFDPEFILKVALYARQELFIRSASNFLLSYSAFQVATRPYLNKYFYACIALPSDWIDVAEKYLTFQDTRLTMRSLPSKLKQVMKSTFQKFDEYQLAKYNRRKHVKNTSITLQQMNSKELKTFTLKQLIRLLHISSPTDHVMSILGKKYPMTSDTFQRSGLPGIWDPKKAGQRMKLPEPETWETKVSSGGNKAEVWESLIDHLKLPYMAMIRNLRNLIISGISTDHHGKILNHLENKYAVMKSKLFPIQFFTAYKIIDEIKHLAEKTEESHSLIGKPTKTKWEKKKNDALKKSNIDLDLLQKYANSVSNALEMSTLTNILPIGGKTLLICDVSHSSPNANEKNKSSWKKDEQMMYENCLIMGLMCLRGCEDCKLNVIYNDGSIEVIQMKNELFMEKILNLCKKVQDNIAQRIAVSSPKKALQQVFEHYLKMETSRTVKLDNLVVFRGNSRLGYNQMKDITRAFLHKYRHTINPELLYTQVDLKTPKQSCLDFCSSDGKDIYLCGLSAQILRFIAERSEGGQLSYIENIDAKYDLAATSTENVAAAFNEDLMVSEDNLSLSSFSRLPKWHTAKIFISSTFKDMHAERDLIVRYVIPELRIRAASIFVKINEVDLRWGITEADCATKRASELCILEAQQCDFFIGVLGERYGAVYDFEPSDIPELTWVKDYPAGSSITELEMYGGALRDPVLNSSKAFFYFRSCSFLREVPQNWKKCFETEDPESKTKLENLKQSIRTSGFKVFEQYPCYYAGTVNDKPLVAGLDKFGEEVLEDLWRAVSQTYEKESFLDEITEEDFAQNEIFEKHNFFVGEKTSSMNQFIQMLNKGDGIFVLSGPAGCGKTSFIVHMLKKIGRTCIIKFFIGVSPRSTDVGFILRYISNMIATQFPVSSLFPSENNDFINQFPDILLEAKKSNKRNSLTLIFDGLDHLDFDDQRLDWLPLDIPKGIIILCSASNSSVAYKTLCERKRTGSAVYIHELSPLQVSDREHLVRNHLQTYGKKLEETAFNNQMMQLVTKKESGNPLYLQLACEYLRKFAVFNNLTSTLHSFPSSVSLVYEEIILQLENEYGSMLTQTTLTLISICKQGLEEDELYFLISFVLLHADTKHSVSFDELDKKLRTVQPDNMLPSMKFRSFLHLLCTFLYGRTRVKKVFLTCSVFKKSLKKYYINKNDSSFIKYLHLVLGAFYKTVCDPKMDGTWMGFSASSFWSLLYHLCCGMCYNELAGMLCDHNFIEAAFRFQAADQLYECFNFLLNSVSTTMHKEVNLKKIECYYDFISRNAHILSCSPHLVFQQARNEPVSALTYLESSEMKGSYFVCLSRSTIIDFRHHTLKGFLKNIVSVSIDNLKSLALLGTEDGYLKVVDLAMKRVTNSLKGHFSAISFICCAGKNIICTASADNTLCIWNSFTYNRLAVLKGHKHHVTGCCAEPSGRLLFSSSLDKTVRVWSSVDGRQISVLDDFSSPLNCIDHHPELQEIACGLWNGNIEIWDTIALKKKLVLENLSGSIKSVVFTPDGINILSSTINSDVNIWATVEGLKVASLSGHSLPVRSISCSKTGMFITAGEDCILKVWSNYDSSPITLSQCKFSAVGFMEFVQSSHLALAFENSDIWILDSTDGHTILTFDSKEDPVMCFSKLQLTHAESVVEYQKWQNCLIFGTSSGKIMALEYSKSVPEMIGSINAKITVLIHCPSFVLFGSDNGDVGVYFLNDPNHSRVIFGAHKGLVTALSLHYDLQEYYALSSSTDKMLKMWKITAENIILELHTYHSKHKDYITCCCFFNRTKIVDETGDAKILTGSLDNNIILWNLEEQIILTALQTSVVKVFCSKQYVIGCASDGSVSVWSHNSNLTSFVPGNEMFSSALAFDFHEDSNVSEDFDVSFAYVGRDGSVIIKHPLQRTQICTLEGHNKTVTSCCSGEKGTLLSCSLDGSVNFWKVPSNLPEKSLKHTGKITSISLSPSQCLAVSSDIYGRIVLWKVDSLSQESPMTYLASKSFSHGCVVTAVKWISEDECVCALNLHLGDTDLYALKILSCKHASCDTNDAFFFCEKSTFVVKSEVIAVDYNKHHQCISAALKSGHVMLVSPDYYETLFLCDAWIVGATFSSLCPDILCTSDFEGQIRCYSLPSLLQGIADLSNPLVTFHSNDSSDGESVTHFVTAFYCDDMTTAYTGDSYGWLRSFSGTSRVVKRAHAGKISCICIHGPHVFTSSFDKTIKSWDRTALDQMGQYCFSSPITCLAIPKDSSETDSREKDILIFGTNSGNVHFLLYLS